MFGSQTCQDASMNTPILSSLLSLYPALQQLPEADLHEVIDTQARVLRASVHTQLFDEGQLCGGFPMLLSGEVRVARGSEQGRSLELYRVGPGELCVVSAATLFGQGPLPAHGVVSADAVLLLVSPIGFARWTAYEGFRQFVFGQLSARLADVMSLAEAVAFKRLDQRLAGQLLGHGRQILMTHQALADELGTVREMVTRLLKRFERDGWIRLGRERIEVLNPEALRLAAGAL